MLLRLVAGLSTSSSLRRKQETLMAAAVKTGETPANPAKKKRQVTPGDLEEVVPVREKEYQPFNMLSSPTAVFHI